MQRIICLHFTRILLLEVLLDSSGSYLKSAFIFVLTLKNLVNLTILYLNLYSLK